MVEAAQLRVQALGECRIESPLGALVARQGTTEHYVDENDRVLFADTVAMLANSADTYDSCARAKQIFGVSRAIVVTQSYHIERAVALCHHLGLDASGIGDDTVRIYRDPWRSSAARENGAVVKAMFDVVSGRDPIFLGRYETTVDDALRLG